MRRLYFSINLVLILEMSLKDQRDDFKYLVWPKFLLVWGKDANLEKAKHDIFFYKFSIDDLWKRKNSRWASVLIIKILVRFMLSTNLVCSPVGHLTGSTDNNHQCGVCSHRLKTLQNRMCWSSRGRVKFESDSKLRASRFLLVDRARPQTGSVELETDWG